MNGPTLTCYPSGRKVHLERPTVDQISIGDIAHHLSLINRYLGGSAEPYNNAQHSWFVSVNVVPECRLAALLHDAAEAYTGDLPGQYKHLPEMQWYRDNQDLFTRVIMEKFGVVWNPDIKAYIKMIEKKLFPWEEYLTGRGVLPDWNEHPKMSMLWSPRVSEKKFLKRFNGLYRGDTE